jgi:tol-pal system protein YbgF
MRRKAGIHSKKARGISAVRLFGFLLACTVLVPAAAGAQATPPLYESPDSAASDSAATDAAPAPLTPQPSSPLSLMPVTSAPAAPLTPAASNEMRLQQLESELRAMTGRQEENTHQIQLLQQSLEQATARLTALEQKQMAPAPAEASVPATVGAPPAGMPPQPAASSAGSLTQPDLAPPASDRFTGGTSANPVNPSANPSEGTLGTLTQPRGGSVTTAATPLTPPKAAADTPDAAYEQAYASFTAKKYDEAEAAFQAFLTQYPKHPLAANAQFWIGECQYAQSEFGKAAKSFALAYQNYPQGPKGPDSLLKLGLSLNSLGKKTEACLTWAQLKKQFPSAGPVLTRAAAEAGKSGCKN